MKDLHEILDDVKELAKKVGSIQLINFRKENLYIESKSTAIDLVTEVDKFSEEIILNHLKNVYPNHGILSEESGKFDKESDYLWVVDPLDGTNNYANGIPIFAISIALQYKDETMLGVVYAPYINEMFSAIKGEGAFLNQRKLRIGTKNSLVQSIVATGFPYDKATHKANNITYTTAIVPKVRGFRRCGAAAVDLSYVAAGFFDGYWEMNINLWDVAAGILLVEEAGGKVVNFRDDRKISIIAGNETICNLLLNEVQEVDKNY
ncbi:MAG: inositol monophosphatase family protein [Clostridium sp.]